MLPKGFADNRYSNVHNNEIENIIDSTTNATHGPLCNFLHGTRLSTLLSMVSTKTSDELQGCILSKNKADSEGIKITTGNCRTLIEGEDDYVNNGSMVSMVSYHDEDTARHYATSPLYYDRTKGHIPPLIFGIKDSINNAESIVDCKNEVVIEALEYHKCIDNQVFSHVPSDNISAIFVDHSNTSKISDIITCSKLSHAKIIGIDL